MVSGPGQPHVCMSWRAGSKRIGARRSRFCERRSRPQGHPFIDVFLRSAEAGPTGDGHLCHPPPSNLFIPSVLVVPTAANAPGPGLPVLVLASFVLDLGVLWQVRIAQTLWVAG